MSPSDGPRTGYVLKMYPRFSETFVVSEILGREAAGESLEILSLRPPVDPRFHSTLGRVLAPVTYVDRPHKPSDWWATLAAAARDLPGLASRLDRLLAADADTAVQAVSVAAHARRAGLTHLHAHFATVAAEVAALAAELAGIPFSITAHAKDLFHESVDRARLAELFDRAHHVVTVSDYNAAWIRRWVGTGRVERVYNGIDLTAFPYGAPAAAPDRTICAVGRLVEKKGFPVLLDAVALLRDRGRPVRLELAGSGPLQAELLAGIDRLALDGLVRLLGPLAQHEVVELLRRSRVLVVPSQVGSDGNADGLPTVLLESMALGVPCVASDVTGIPEVIRHGRTGLLVPQRDATAVADAIESLLSDRALALRCSRQARNLVEQDFDVRQQADRLARLQSRATADLGAA